MKKLLLVICALGVAITAWRSAQASLDPSLLRVALREVARHKGVLGNEQYLTIIDYRKSLMEPRLFVVEVATRRIVLRCRVSHALRSGLLYASSFSNKVGSEQSSLGVYLTDQQPYLGKFGQALRVDGLSRGTNNNARTRTIVFHADPGYQWSNGCFMTSAKVNSRLVTLIAGRSLVLAYK